MMLKRDAEMKKRILEAKQKYADRIMKQFLLNLNLNKQLTFLFYNL